jgi:hypothetical protein
VEVQPFCRRGCQLAYCLATLSTSP